MDEAPLRETPAGLVPQGDGWFVLNARDAVWMERDGFGSRCGFEADGRVAAALGVDPHLFPQLGIKLAVIEPGQRSTLYHAETAQEDFLVLEGECLAIVEDTEIVGGDAAVAWGRVRSDRVFIRLGHTEDTYYAAGAERAVEYPEWPGEKV